MGTLICSGIADECADSLENQVEMHELLGWQYLELRNVNGTTIDTLADEDFARSVETLRRAGMGVSCLASDIGKLWLDGPKYQPFSQDLESLPSLLERAQALDCKFIRVMAYHRESLSDKEWREQGIARLRELGALAEKAQIYLGLENCCGWHSYDGQRMVEVLEAVDSEYVVALYDTGNTGRDGADAWEYYSTVKPFIKYVHIKDWAGEGKGYTLPGQGFSSVTRILQDLKDSEYTGFISIEPHMAGSAHLPHLQGNPWATYKEYGETLNRLLEAL